jgi:hypothetical protein
VGRIAHTGAVRRACKSLVGEIDGWIIFKWTLKEVMGGCGLD